MGEYWTLRPVLMRVEAPAKRGTFVYGSVQDVERWYGQEARDTTCAGNVRDHELRVVVQCCM